MYTPLLSKDICHLPKNSENSSWKVNGTHCFGIFQCKFSGKSGKSEKVVLNFHFKVRNGSSGKCVPFTFSYQFWATDREFVVMASEMLGKSESIKMVEVGGGCSYQCSNCAFLSSDTNYFINHHCDIFLRGKIVIDVYSVSLLYL